MNKAWIAAALCVIFVIFFSIVLFIPNENSLNPVKEVKVTVLSGSVDVENKDGSIEQNLSGGESLTIDENQKMIMTPSNEMVSPTPIPNNSKNQSTIDTSTLLIIALDTANQPIPSASVQIQLNDIQQWFSLDESGRVEIPGLPVGEVFVKLHDSAFFNISPVTEMLIEPLHEITLTVPRKISVPIKIVGKSFKPVANADTIIIPDESIQTLVDLDLELKKSNNEGLLEFNPVTAGDYVLQITAQPYLPHIETITAQRNSETTVIHLKDKSSLTVHVQDEEDEPIFAAKVTLHSVGSEQGITLVQETSQVSGDAVFHELAPGKYNIQALHDWYNDEGDGTQEFNITHDKHNIDLTLKHREYTITGTVYDQASGTPVEGAEVVAFSDHKIKQTNLSDPLYDYIHKKFSMEPDATFKTSKDGTFHLVQLHGGSYTIGIKPRKDFVFVPFTKDWQYGGEDYNPVVLLEDTEQVHGVDINLLRSWKILGKVMKENGTVMPDAEVRILAEYRSGKHYAYVHTYGYGDESLQHRIKVNNDGTYMVKGNSYVFDDNFKLKINASHKILREAYEGTGLLIEIQPGETKSEVDLIFPSKIEISGNVKSDEDNPLPNARILVSLIGGNSTAYIYTDESGYYYSAFNQGEYIISAAKDGYLSESIYENLKLEEGNNKRTIDFLLKKGDERFEGIITDEENNPIPNKVVNLSYSTSMFRSGWDSRLADENGRFTLTPTGGITEENIVYRIYSNADEQYEESVFETTERGIKNIQLIAKKYNEYSSLSGLVVDHNNQPITQFDIKIIPTAIRSYSADYYRIYNWQPVSHPNGAFAIEKIPVTDGPFLVAARALKMAPAFSEPVTILKDLPVSNVQVMLQEETFSIRGIVHSSNTPYHSGTVLFVPNHPPQIKSFDSHSDGYSQFNLSYPNDITLENGIFNLDGLPVSGGRLMVRPRWDDKEHQITMFEIESAQPNIEIDLGIIQLSPSE